MVRNVMSGKSRFMIAAPTSSNWYDYTGWFTSRGKPAPVHSTDGVFVFLRGDEPTLLAACSIFPTDGPFAVVEYAATNPRVPMRLAHDAMAFGVLGIVAYGAVRGKAMICFPSSKGMQRMLARQGFSLGAREWMECSPWQL